MYRQRPLLCKAGSLTLNNIYWVSLIIVASTFQLLTYELSFFKRSLASYSTTSFACSSTGILDPSSTARLRALQLGSWIVLQPLACELFNWDLRSFFNRSLACSSTGIFDPSSSARLRAIIRERYVPISQSRLILLKYHNGDYQ